MKPILADLIISRIQKKYFKGIPANSFEKVAKEVDMLLENGVRYRNEIRYSDQYANSFFDIYYGSEEITLPRPTIVLLHGGGFFMGSRVSGDPLANIQVAAGMTNGYLAKAGFNIVVPDYCLAPKYRYPDQLFQVNELFTFLLAHGAEYHLDTQNIVLMGGSAGAVFTAQYGVILSNPDYAARMGITPAIGMDWLKGVIIDGAPMNPARMNWATATMFRTWLNISNLKTSRQAQEIHAALWVNGSYPPAFLTAGNDGCYAEDARELHAALIKNGVDSTLFIVDIKDQKEPHGYLNKFQTDPFAKEGLDRLLAFAKRRTS
jgi:acetyl esterase/lipase